MIEKQSLITRSNEHYYRAIPADQFDAQKILVDLDVGVNLLLDGIGALIDDDDRERAIDLLMEGLSKLTYSKYLLAEKLAE
jgi:hypothetical protein